MRLGCGLGLGSVGNVATRAVLGTVPATMYYKVATTVPIAVTNGRAWTLTINGVTAATGTGTGTTQNASVTPTTAMASATAAVVLTAGSVTDTDVTDCWAPTLLGAKLRKWWDETGTYDGSGWAGTYGSSTLAPGASAPTTSTQNGRRTIACSGAAGSYLAASYTRAQPGVTWGSAKCVGATPVALGVLWGGGATNGYFSRRATGTTAMRIYAGTTLDVTAASDLADRWAVFGTIVDGASSQAWDGTTSMGTGDPGTGAIGGQSVGATGAGNSPLACEVGELLDLTSAPTTAERGKITAYLAAVWGITL